MGKSINWMVTAREIVSLIAIRRWRWPFAFLVGQAVPGLEVTFVASLCLIVDPQKRMVVIERSISYLPFLSGLGNLSAFDTVSLVAFVGMAMLAASVAVKCLSDLSLVRLVCDACLDASRALVGRYLCTSASVARRVGKGAVTSGIMVDCDAAAHISQQVLSAFGVALSMLVCLVVAAFLSWEVLLIGPLVYGVLFCLSRRSFGRMQDVGKMKIGAQEKIIAYFSDTLGGSERAKLDALEATLSDASGRMLCCALGLTLPVGIRNVA